MIKLKRCLLRLCHKIVYRWKDIICCTFQLFCIPFSFFRTFVCYNASICLQFYMHMYAFNVLNEEHVTMRKIGAAYECICLYNIFSNCPLLRPIRSDCEICHFGSIQSIILKTFVSFLSHYWLE